MIDQTRSLNLSSETNKFKIRCQEGGLQNARFSGERLSKCRGLGFRKGVMKRAD
jgi:hypothetical protein